MTLEQATALLAQAQAALAAAQAKSLVAASRSQALARVASLKSQIESHRAAITAAALASLQSDDWMAPQEGRQEYAFDACFVEQAEIDEKEKMIRFIEIGLASVEDDPLLLVRLSQDVASAQAIVSSLGG